MHDSPLRRDPDLFPPHFFPFTLLALFCAPDGDCQGEVQPRDEVRVDDGSCAGVAFANRATEKIRHEDSVARQRERDGIFLQSCDEVRVNHGSCGGVVFADRARVDGIRHQEVVAIHR